MKTKNTTKFKILIFLAIFFALVFPFSVFSYSGIDFLDISSESIGYGQVRIKWTTNVSTTGKIVYGDDRNDLAHYVSENKSASRWHVVEIGNLEEDKKYYFQITASNGTDLIKSYINEFEVDESFEDEKSAPEIDDLEIDYISETAAAIRWKTDVPATSYVEYGLDADFGKKASNKKKTREHLVILKKLEPEEQYFIKVYSHNEDEIKSSEHHRQFYTMSEGTKNEEELIVSHFKPNSPSDSNLSATYVAVSFKTNNLSSGSLTIKKEHFKTKKINIAFDTNHYINVMDLSPETCYDFKLYMKDIYGGKFKKTYNLCTVSKNKMSIINSESSNYTFQNHNTETFITGDSIIVAGIEYERYPQLQGVFKTNDSPKVWLIVNNQRHLVNSHEALVDYGYDWQDVKIVAWPKIAQYKSVKLVKTPDRNTVYYLHERKNGVIAKTAIASPEIFNSYSENRWEDIVTISQFDFALYDDVKLFGAENNDYIYYVIGDTKHFVSHSIFLIHNFDINEVLNVSTIHLNSFLTGEDFK